jgi:hypothetical protein
MAQTHPVTTGTISGTPVVTDLLAKGNGANPWDQVKVHLSANYVTAAPPGYPNRPPAGQAASKLGPSGTLASGVTVTLFSHEAAAVVAAGGGSYA